MNQRGCLYERQIATAQQDKIVSLLPLWGDFFSQDGESRQQTTARLLSQYILMSKSLELQKRSYSYSFQSSSVELILKRFFQTQY